MKFLFSCRYFGFFYLRNEHENLTQIPTDRVQTILFALAKKDIELILTEDELKIFRQNYGETHARGLIHCQTVKKETKTLAGTFYLGCLDSNEVKDIDISNSKNSFDMPSSSSSSSILNSWVGNFVPTIFTP